MTSPTIRSKTLAIAAAAFALASTLVAVPAAQAKPTLCIQYGWIMCDPQFTRGTPEWQACFGYYSEEACPYADGAAKAGPLLNGAGLEVRLRQISKAS
ncbi:hypothetical protein [Caulobacter sp. LARHSG274]